ncbi:MAG: hypothetical protein GXP61_08160 [Epsilonproteobacteria bacterium]|nr:hypothetical protein [Campylobacterota bacterium]
MKFSQNVSFLKNIEFGLWESNKSLEDLCSNCDAKLSSVKTRLYMINLYKKLPTPLDKKLDSYLKENCTGYKEWAKEMICG